MDYITKEYYNDTFQGTPATDDAELAAIIHRASDLVDSLTRYLIPQAGLASCPEFVQEQVKKATAYQVEYFIQNGGLATANSGQGVAAESVTVGKFTMRQARTAKQGNTDSRISPAALSCLEPTGLLYRGVGGCGVW